MSGGPGRFWRVARILAAICIGLCAWTAAAAAPTPQPSETPGWLAPLKARIEAGAFGNVHALIVVQRGRTLAEWYFQGADQRRGAALGPVVFGPDTLHDVRSVSKSVISLLFGAALSDHAIESLDEPVLDFFPEYADLRTPERLKIRLRDVLSMTSGLKWDERTVPYTHIDPKSGQPVGNPGNSEVAMDLAPDRYRYVLSQPIVAEPGTRWEYSGGDVAIAAAVIARATKTPLDVYAQRKLFGPLGVRRFEWIKDDKGVPIAASGLRLRPTDMVKLGELVLQNGRWNGRQVVAEDWVRLATSPHAQIDPAATCGRRYGYFWWLIDVCAGGRTLPLIFAVGNGGQYIYVARSLDAVVVTTAGAYDDPKGADVDGVTRAVLTPLWPAPGQP